MIRSLYISNYALITELSIDFVGNFNIITGETGAGKSIILGALSLLLGERADMKAVRDADKKSIIDAVFDNVSTPEFKEVLESADVDDIGDTITMRRELLPGGRSRAFVNDTPVNLTTLREIGVYLVDIHSQHQNLLLGSQKYQLQIIDSLSGNAPLIAKYREAYANYRVALKKYVTVRDSINQNKRDVDFIEYQYSQLNELDIQRGEDEQLEIEYEQLSNQDDVKEKLSAVLTPLENSVSSLVTTSSAMDSLSEVINSNVVPTLDLDSLMHRLESARVELDDIFQTLYGYESTVQSDSNRLEEVEVRRAKLQELKARYNVGTSDDLLALREKLSAQLAEISDADTIIADLEREAKRAKRMAVILAAELTASRQKTAEKFANELWQRAQPLGMANLRCKIEFAPVKLCKDGADQINFLFAFNKNQELLPVGETASGGEISRLMLVVKSIVAESMALPSIIFDEVDTGVSGEVAARMGEMMANISNNIQVITITHLPGVAALGNRHFKVFKCDDATSTSTQIKVLDNEDRIVEIATMLSGNVEEASIANAKALLAKADAVK